MGKMLELPPWNAVGYGIQGLDVKVYAAYKDLIRLAWKDVSHDDSPIEFDFQPQDVYQPQARATENSFREFIKPSVPLSGSFRFENFVPGDKAQLAFNAALAVARNPDGTQYKRTCSSPSATTFSKKIRPSA